MRQKRYILLISIFLLVLMILFAGISGMSSPTKNVSKVSGEYVHAKKIANAGYENEETNALTRDKEKKVTECVNQYYVNRAEQKDYIEYYKNIEVYMKDGPYVGTYITFVRYDMKIKGVYTEVPGLDTLYAEKDSDGDWHITKDISEENLKQAVQHVAAHTDVTELLEQTESEYQSSIASDGILRESLSDLENALN